MCYNVRVEPVALLGKHYRKYRAQSKLTNHIIPVRPSSFKPPIRTTLMDPKREQWMQELAGGLVPLRKLARNVPHGFKGEKLLETLASKQVPFLRATWYIKIVGLSEMVRQKNNKKSIVLIIFVMIEST